MQRVRNEGVVLDSGGSVSADVLLRQESDEDEEDEDEEEDEDDRNDDDVDDEGTDDGYSE